MQSSQLWKTLLLTSVLVIVFVQGWEYYWRRRGFTATQNDDKVLWASKRKEVYNSPPKTTVLIGGSRIKFDVDIPTWEKLTGDEVVQLALVGTPARLVLRDLARDKNFKGKLIIDVAEQQFFSFDTLRRDKSAREALAYYYSETPAQKASAFINYNLESTFAFLEEGKFSLNLLLKDLPLPPRDGVFIPPSFPKEFGLTTGDRQTYMSSMFLNTPKLQQIQANIWKNIMIVGMEKAPAIKPEMLDKLLSQVKRYVDMITSRGGKVIFVRPPSSGILYEAENKYFPRDQYWNKLLTYTHTPGIHFKDYPTIANFVCPETSHLSSNDAIVFTTQLVFILKNEKGWSFPNLKAEDSNDIKP